MQEVKRIKNKTIRKIVEYRFLYFLALPIVAYLLIYRYYPIITQFMLSFREYAILEGIFGSEWTGFNN